MKINEVTTTFYTFNTSLYLLKAYEEMAAQISRGGEERVYQDENGDYYDDDEGQTKIIFSEENIAINLALINFNAAIIEGTIRQVFASLIASDHNRVGKISQDCDELEDKKKLFRSYNQIKKLHLELELSGGWDSLKNNISQYLNFKVEDFMDDKEAFTVLFTLRNSTAHGTALVRPATKIPDDYKDIYPYKWQSKLHGVEMYVQKHFSTDLFQALKHPFLLKNSWSKP